MSPPTRFRSGACAIATALAVLLSAPSSRAQGADDAIRRGVELRRQHRDAEALVEFTRAYAATPTPRLRAQIALAEHALGRWRAAEEDLAAALDAETDPWIGANRVALELSRREIASHLATLRVTTNASSARVRINDASPIPLPCSVRVEAGTVALRVETPDAKPLERVRVVQGETLVDEDFTFGALAGARAGPASGVAATSSIGAPPRTLAPRVPRSDRQSWAWVSLGAAAGPLAFGVVESIVREERVRYWNNEALCPPGLKEAVCGAERAGAEQATVLSIAAYASAVTLMTVGAVLLWAPSVGTVRLTGWAAPGGGGGALIGGF
jgi:hypothetical protein